MHGHHWKALGVVAAAFGATVIYWANENGYHREARCLTVGAIMAGGVATAIAIFTDGEQRRTHYELTQQHVVQGTQAPTPPAQNSPQQLQALRVMRSFA